MIDKVKPEEKEAAHTKFQEIAFAYAILSDERRRKRYDSTGNTSESLDIDDDDFNWISFFRAQWQDTVTQASLDKLKGSYQGSDEEKQDVLTAYITSKGDLNKIFNVVMLSNPLDDEDRFRAYINLAIKAGDVEGFAAYLEESDKRKKARYQKAQREAEEAAKHAESMGMNGKGKTTKRRSKQEDESDLFSLIQNRNKDRAANFLDDLEAKYAPPKKGRPGAKAQNGKKRNVKEPPEEAFKETPAVAKKRKTVVSEDSDTLTHDNEIECDHEEKSSDEDIDSSRTKARTVKKKGARAPRRTGA